MKQRVKLLFPRQLVKEPILFTMAKRYDVIPNIRRARITDDGGEMILELEGDAVNLEHGIAALREQGITVEFIEGEIFNI
jgi:ABC-type methionine transport system ATPase subunit